VLQILIYRWGTLGELFEKSSPRPLKNFSENFYYKVSKTFIVRVFQVILVLRTLCEERLRREPRGRQRELALFSARGAFAAQNDVKFAHTHARKVLVKFFQKLAGCGAEPHIVSPTNINLLQSKKHGT